MPAGTKSDFVIYDEQFWGGTTETLQQNASGFNAASNGALALVPRRIKGDFERESFVQAMNLVNRRDTGSVAAVADNGLSQDEYIGVKVNRRIGPVAQTLDSWRKLDEDPRAMSFLLGRQTGQAIAEDYINTALTSLVAATAAQASMVVTKAATIAHSDLVSGLATMGDQSSRIVAWVMHSKVYFDLVDQAMADDLFDVGAIVVKQGTTPTLGRPVIVTDSPALITSGTPDTYHTLALVRGAGEVAESENREIIGQQITGTENILFRVQGEYAFNVKLKGYKWDVSGGGANPTDAALGTGSNWDKVATSDKSLAGAIITTQ